MYHVPNAFPHHILYLQKKKIVNTVTNKTRIEKFETWEIFDQKIS